MIKRETWWLTCIAILAVAYLFIFEFDRTDKTKTIPILVRPFEVDEITAIQIIYNGTNIVRTGRTSDRWMLEVPVHYPAMAEGPNALLQALSRLQPLSYHKLSGASSGFGFEPPHVDIYLERGAGKIELQLGDFTPLEDKIYARIPEKSGVFTIDREFLNVLPFTANHWRDPKLFHLDKNRLDVNRINIRSGPRQMLLQKTTNNIWQIAQPAPIKRANQTRIKQTLVKLWNWNAITFESDDPGADLQRYGLHSPEAELMLGQGTNRLAVIQFGNSPTNQPGHVYARRLNHTNIVVIPKPWLKDLRARVWEYCDHHLVDSFDPGADSLGRIEVESVEPFMLEQSTNGVWNITQPSTLPADNELVINFLGKLRSLQAIAPEREVVGDYSTYGLDQPSGQYTLRQRGGTNTIISRISFGSPAGENGNHVFTRRHDEGTVYVISQIDRRSLPVYFYQLRNRKYWDFSAEEVIKITVNRGGEVVELLRSPKGIWTRAGSPITPEKRDNIPTALNALGNLQVATWTARGADKLATYDILERKKSLTLEIKRDGKTFTRKVQFGKQAASLNFYAYATDPLEQEPVVFEFPLNTYNACEIILFPLLAAESREQ